MAGYAATVRITHVAPRIVATHSAGTSVAPELAVAIEPVEAAIEEVEAAIEEVSGQPFLAEVTYLWDDIREVWRQAMYVMSDPHGWR
jgi:hypothetical protein